jgi:hypothetical protein
MAATGKGVYQPTRKETVMARGRKRKAQEPEIPTVETQAPPEGPPQLEEVAEAVAAGEAEPGPGPPMSEEEAAQLQPGDVADLSGAIAGTPTEALRRIVAGIDPPGLDVTGARISFGYRPRKWRDVEAVGVATVDAEGRVLVGFVGGNSAGSGIPYGDREGCWKFRE